MRASESWGPRYRRWRRHQVDLVRACIPIIMWNDNPPLIESLRDAIVQTYETPFIVTHYACDGREPFRFKKDVREAVRAAGGKKTWAFRCYYCKRWHRGRIPAQYLSELRRPDLPYGADNGGEGVPVAVIAAEDAVRLDAESPAGAAAVLDERSATISVAAGNRMGGADA